MLVHDHAGRALVLQQALAVEELQGRFMLQDFVHTFVGQAAPDSVKLLVGFGQDVEPGEGKKEGNELIGLSAIQWGRGAIASASGRYNNLRNLQSLEGNVPDARVTIP